MTPSAIGRIVAQAQRGFQFFARSKQGFPLLLVLAGVGAVLFGFGSEMLGLGGRELGRVQRATGWLGAGLVVAGIGLDWAVGRKYLANWASELWQDPRRLAGLAGITAQLILLTLVIQQYQIENLAFYRHIMPLAVTGFLIHHFLPRHLRLAFFAFLSLLGIYVVLGPEKTAWVVGLGLALMALCHVPAAFGLRVVLLLSVGALLMAFRANWVKAPWPSVILPILGSLFMFRLIVYVYDLPHLTEAPRLSERLSYFFMLPNVVFPLFPVVDFKVFRRTWYDADPLEIYQRGVHWMFRGVVHLLLYRYLSLYLLITPEQVQTVGQLVQYIVANFLLYLRVSGQFHLIVGLLHLFGFHLPETHHQYCLATSFLDFYRRINIYWKDFMMKVFYYPAYFRLKRLGPTAALVLATVFVFLMTWSLHSYQWFWLRGSFLFVGTDMLFWGLLAASVVANSLYEARHPRRGKLGKAALTSGTFLREVAKAVAMFAAICLLWSLWTSATPGEWLALWRVSGGWEEALLWLGGVVLFLAGGVGWNYLTEAAAEDSVSKLSRVLALGRAPLAAGAALVVLYAAASPALRPWLTRDAGELVSSLRVPKLSGREAALLRRGYYEDLVGVNTATGQLWELFMKRPDDWVPVHQSQAARETQDFIGREHVPSVGIIFHGEPYTTNRWGMRDRDYEQKPAAGTYRIAVLGSSYAVGSGVGDGESFEALLEDRLNRENPNPAIRRYELLNFAFGGYTPIQQVALLENKVVPFEPDALVLNAHRVEPEWSVTFLARRSRRVGEIPYEPLREILRRAGVEPQTPVEESRKRLQRFGDELVSWAYGRIVETCRAHGILPFWVYLPYEPGVREPRGPVENASRLAREAGFQALDLSGVYDGHDPSSLQVAEWDSHPNRKGHQLIAEALHRALQRHVKEIPLRIGDGS